MPIEFIQGAIEGKPGLVHLIITDYCYNFINQKQRKKFDSLSLEEKLSTFSEEVQSININKKILKVVDSYRIKIPASMAAIIYSKLFQNEKVKKLITTAIDKNDLKAALIIDNLYDKLNQEEAEEILNQENSLEEKAIGLLNLYYAQKAIEILASIQKKSVEMEAEVSTVWSEGGLSNNNISKVSYIMQQVKDYLSECNKFKKSKYLVDNNKLSEIKNAISLLNNIKNSIQEPIYHRAEEIKEIINQIDNNIEQANKKQLHKYKKILNIYLKEHQLIKKANILYK